MTDLGKPGNADTIPQQDVQVVIEISISLYSNGKVEMKGPLSNKPGCYGMLESAKDIVRSYQDKISHEGEKSAILNPADVIK